MWHVNARQKDLNKKNTTENVDVYASIDCLVAMNNWIMQ